MRSRVIQDSDVSVLVTRLECCGVTGVLNAYVPCKTLEERLVVVVSYLKQADARDNWLEK